MEHKTKDQEQFWSCKFTFNSNLNEKEIEFFFESIYKSGKNYKLGDVEIQKQKFHQHKRPIL